MGGLSIWHWLIVLGLFGLLLVLPVYAGIKNGQELPSLTRGNYIKALLVIVGIIIAMRVVAAAVNAPGLSAALGLTGPFFNYAIVRRVVQRLRDASYSASLAWLCLIPLVNLIMFLVVCFIPSRTPTKAVA